MTSAEGRPELHVSNQHASRRLDEPLCRRVLQHVVSREGSEIASLTLVLLDHEHVRELNRRYLDHDFDTDVLAFNYSEREGLVDGEIYVDLDTATERHEEFDATFEEEALRYAIHGLLHLLGYGDRTSDDRDRMRRLEDLYLEELGLRS